MDIFKKLETDTHKIYKILGISFKFDKNYKNRDTNNIWVVDEKGNKKKVRKIKGVKIRFLGTNANIIIHAPMITFRKSKIVCGNNAKVEIKSSNRRANELKVYAVAPFSECFIGNNFSCTENCFIQMNKMSNLKVKIGDDCMFGSFIIIRVTDGHTIIDKTTKEILNHDKDVEIGNHVWLARDVVVMKGVKIPDNCVVGACSVVTKPLTEENAIYAGSPAKKIKSNVEWFRSSIPLYEEAIERGEVPV